jgi:hypothetical protein
MTKLRKRRQPAFPRTTGILIQTTSGATNFTGWRREAMAALIVALIWSALVKLSGASGAKTNMLSFLIELITFPSLLRS